MLFLILLLLLTFQIAAQDLEFISPGPSGTDGDFSLNPSYVFGSSLTIQWEPIEESVSLVLCQQLQGADFEYVFQDRSNLSAFDRTVTTQRDLSKSRTFFFQIFIEGDTLPSATSHYFNITGAGAGDGGVVQTTTTFASASSSPASLATSSAVLQSSTTSSPSSSTSSVAAASGLPTSNTSNDEGAMSTGAKVGLGIGVPVAVVLGVGAGWFLFGDRKKASNTPSSPDNVPYDHRYSGFRPEEYKDLVNLPGELIASFPQSGTRIVNTRLHFQAAPQNAPAELAHSNG
ncbi:hypothetical protein LTR84_002065 [Exophiala bonariae]|uniref:Mid2 domain-containing protein n=1 Tax=Exophiala bonariae TaxID=1690606 RepID=A0AAV9NBI4_9EURO|nr:hypothetical protein LTR84_002065 [Exophiala bonariae]